MTSSSHAAIRRSLAGGNSRTIASSAWSSSPARSLLNIRSGGASETGAGSVTDSSVTDSSVTDGSVTDGSVTDAGHEKKDTVREGADTVPARSAAMPTSVSQKIKQKRRGPGQINK